MARHRRKHYTIGGITEPLAAVLLVLTVLLSVASAAPLPLPILATPQTAPKGTPRDMLAHPPRTVRPPRRGVRMASVLGSEKTVATASSSSSSSSSDHERRSMTVGSSCSQEGQWNCMGTSWQRCAAQQWSPVMQCAAGTQCVPSGLSYDFAVVSKSSSSSSSGGDVPTSGSAPRAARLASTVRLSGQGAVTGVRRVVGRAGAVLGNNKWMMAMVVASVSLLVG